MLFRTPMRLRTHIAVVALVFATLVTTAGTAVLVPAPVDALQEFDEEVPPGNPVLGDDRPGDIEDTSSVNYLLWGLVGLCLLGAGGLLIKVERWEARRMSDV